MTNRRDAGDSSRERNLHDVLLYQLDGLVVFLAAAHEEVFRVIHQNRLTWFPLMHDPQIPGTAAAFRASIANAAFLLGYAYFESFLANLARDMLRNRPQRLGRDGQVKHEDILKADSKEDLIRLIVERKVRSVFGGSIEDVQGYFQREFQLPWPHQDEIVRASRMRNCLMHNGGLADERLAQCTAISIGTQIVLEQEEVNDLGRVARDFARTVWAPAVRDHL